VDVVFGIGTSRAGDVPEKKGFKIKLRSGTKSRRNKNFLFIKNDEVKLNAKRLAISIVYSNFFSATSHAVDVVFVKKQKCKIILQQR
jgi:hypothetical protein